MDSNYIQSIKDLVNQDWSLSQPEFFITLLWTDYPRQFDTVKGHMSILKNKLLCHLHNLNRCSDIPDANHRLGMTVFHEKGLTKPIPTLEEIVSYHTHIHMFNVNNSLKNITPDGLRKLIQRKIGSTVKKLDKTYNESYKGVDVRVWDRVRHQNYNFKDYDRYRGHQDEDLTLDYKNSDFISLLD